MLSIFAAEMRTQSAIELLNSTLQNEEREHSVLLSQAAVKRDKINAIREVLAMFSANEGDREHLVFLGKGTLKQRVLDCIKAVGKGVSSFEIARALSPYYPDKDKLKLRRQVSVILHEYKTAGELYSLEGRKGNKFYLPQWCGENKEPLEKYK